MGIVKRLLSFIPVKYKRLVRKVISRYYPFRIDYAIDEDVNLVKKKLNIYFALRPALRKKYLKEIEFLNRNADAVNSSTIVIPYPFVLNYDPNLIEVYKDEDRGMFYVMYKGKKLYYSRDYRTEWEVKSGFNGITVEQDERSPHRYINIDFTIEEGDIVIDIGAAEGNFSLEVIEKVSKLYIFETDIKWIEALNATFGPWKEKVQIINKFVSGNNDNGYITLDSFLGDKPVDFIKMDVEGEEVQILRGAGKTLNKNDSLKLVLCTYHRKNDAEVLGNILSENGYSCTFSEGYMLFICKKLTPPFFRRGLIRARKVKANE